MSEGRQVITKGEPPSSGNNEEVSFAEPSAKNEDSDSSSSSRSSRSGASATSASSSASSQLTTKHLSQDKIDSVGKEVTEALGQIGGLEMSLESTGADERIMQVLKSAKQTLLRVNLAKNLLKCELSNGKEEARVERDLLLKSVGSKERTLALLRNENEMITARNLKLIRYCRELKNGKLKQLKAENRELRRLLESDPNGPSLKRRHLEGPVRTESFDQEPISASRQSSAMLDTLGRLASHVLEDQKLE